MSDSTATAWLNLSEAARRLGVHTTTVRRWADEGALPFMLTAGGHRRFAAADLDEFIRSRKHTLDTPNPTQVWAEHAIAETRREIVAHQHAPWLAAFNSEEREEKRHLGRRLMGVILQYIARNDSADELLREADYLGRIYAENTQQHGLPLTDALQAVFFFRDTLLETAIGHSEAAPLRPEANARLVRRINTLLNTVQLAIAQTYETT